LEIAGSHGEYVLAWHAVEGDEMRDGFSKLKFLPNPVDSLKKFLLDDGQMWVFVAPNR
jgi:hypothetical protein